jgi:hypothetical protein
MIQTAEDDEFERIERENAMKGQPYHYDVYVSPSQRNQVLEEVAKEFDAMKNGGDTSASFAVYVRSMKSNAKT